MPQKSWAVGEEVLAADFNLYLQNQTVPQFLSTAQRDTQWGSPPNGALCVTTDTNTLWQRQTGAWRARIGETWRSTTAVNNVSIGPAETWLGSVITANLAYPHRVRFNATCIFDPGAAAPTIDMHVRYNTTGAAIAVTDPLARQVRTTGTGQRSLVAVGAVDRAAGGATTIGLLALTSGGTATSTGDPTLGQIEVWAVPT